jgi:beta-lactam-binding protein with PASTA domain
MVGMTLAGARSALAAAGFEHYTWLYSCYGSPNILAVVRQDPGGGAQAPKDADVDIYLQADNCTGTVPNVVGMTLAGARSALAAAGFERYTWLYGCYGSPNILAVVRQDPGSGAQAPQDTDVDIYLQADNC